MMRTEEPAPASKKYSYFNAKWGQAVKINGRVVINLWKIISHEVNLTNYDFDNVCFHLLKKREARFDFDTLTQWWQKSQFAHVTNHLLGKLQGMFSILDTMNFIHRDINMANVYGIDYESVMTRGSQFRVEAILSKISKSQDTLLLSATPEQVHDQNQLEVIPLVIEPEKQFYTDPVVIVDFQSLYPSVIIAYNLCYSTCLGKI
jgi:DNA polymerase zeta